MSARTSLAAKAPEERRRRILAAAVEVLKDKGFAGARIADVAVKDGLIAAIGSITGTASEEIDARGLLVTPGDVIALADAH